MAPMKWRALNLFLVLFLCAEGGACSPSTLSQLPLQKFDWETLQSVTPPVLRARPLANWPSRIWRRAASLLSEAEILGIQNYLTVFAEDPSRATQVFSRKFSRAPEAMKYILNVADNVISCYLLLWELGIHQGDQGMFLDFALDSLSRLRNVEAPLYRNGRVVHQIGLWALHTGPRRYSRYIEVVRQSPWAIVEFQPLFPRPHSR